MFNNGKISWRRVLRMMFISECRGEEMGKNGIKRLDMHEGMIEIDLRAQGPRRMKESTS